MITPTKTTTAATAIPTIAPPESPEFSSPEFDGEEVAAEVDAVVIGTAVDVTKDEIVEVGTVKTDFKIRNSPAASPKSS